MSWLGLSGTDRADGIISIELGTKGTGLMTKALVVDPEKCNGCRLCEKACSLKHYGVEDPERSRIRIDEWEGFFFPRVLPSVRGRTVHDSMPDKLAAARPQDGDDGCRSQAMHRL